MTRTTGLVIMGWLLVGCMEPASEVQTSQAVGSGIDVPPGCYATPGCSLLYQGTYTTALQQQLGCGRTYSYGSAASGFQGGRASFCPDTVNNRRLLNTAGYPGYDATFCTTCLSIPAGQLFVIWQTDVGPGCPSSCAPGVPAPHAF